MRFVPSIRNSFISRLEKIEAVNRTILEYRNRQEELESDSSHGRILLRTLRIKHERLTAKNAEYINEIVDSLRQAIQFSINSVLPTKEYIVQIEYVPFRDSGQLKLYIIDEEGNKLLPKVIEGDMLNEVLSVSGIIYISLQMGINRIFYDEAFSSANVRSLKLINSLIEFYISLGAKFTIVTQNPVLYAGLPRGMVELVSDGKQVVEVKQFNVEPEEEELDIVNYVTDLFDSLTHTKE